MMNIQFWIAQFLVVVFTILLFGAALRPFWSHFRNEPCALDRLPVPEGLSTSIVILVAALSWYNTGIHWILQLTVYPLYKVIAATGRQTFAVFLFSYEERMAWAAFIPATVFCATSGLLLWIRPAYISARIAWVSAGICATIVAFNYLPAKIQLQLLQRGFQPELYSQLLVFTGIRTLLFTFHAFLCVWMLRYTGKSQKTNLS